MILWLLLLIGVGVIISAVSLFSSVEEKGRKSDNLAYQSGIERVLCQIKDQLFQLEIDIKRSSRLTSKLREDVKVIKDKDYSTFGEVLLEKESLSVNNGSEPEEPIRFAEAKQKVRALELENANLRKRVEDMSLEIKNLSKEKDSLRILVSRLKDREKHIQVQLDQMQLDFQELKIGLNKANKSKLEMKEKLFKLKVITSDSEKELERLRAENKELLESLSFERNS